MPRREDFTIDQGSDVEIELYLENPDGTPKSLVNYSAAAQMRRSVNTSDSDAITFTANIKIPETSGIVQLSLTNLQTSVIPAARYLYDVELRHQDSDGTNLIEVILAGVIEVNPNITRL